MTRLSTDILVIGSGAGGATTAARLAAAGRQVTVVEEGPWIDPDEVEPFSLEEMVLKYRHRGSCATLGTPPIAYAEGRCVGGSTEVNSGLWHRLPDHLVEEWATTYAIDEFSPAALAGYAQRVEEDQTVSFVPGAPPHTITWSARIVTSSSVPSSRVRVATAPVTRPPARASLAMRRSGSTDAPAATARGICVRPIVCFTPRPPSPSPYAKTRGNSTERHPSFDAPRWRTADDAGGAPGTSATLSSLSMRSE